MKFTVRLSKPAVQAIAQRRAFSSSPRRLNNYAFIGLGQMGYQMARNLQSKLAPTDTIRLFDINTKAAKKLAQEVKSQKAGGAVTEVSASVIDAAREADTVITCLPEPKHVKDTYEAIVREKLPARPQPRLFIDCSTIDPSSSREVATAVSLMLGEQANFVDAPMSGGVVGATAGTLTFMLGAPEFLVPRAELVLSMMGKRVLHCGAQGTGLAAKLANNYLLAIENIATAEAMNLGVKLGLDPKVLASVINVSTGRCWPSEINNPVPGVVETAPASRDYQGGFGIGLMRKDLRLALVAAGEARVSLPLSEKTSEIYESTEKDERCQGRDFSVVYRWLGGEE
ncbi:NAD binding domain of 6-phosphogluconate dehydrogenase-domain-containing protein [Podospora fimiseda]|uniref:3-hydroxyisobutyrate dehydrogenase n=1 Tax=Podospora fimiseda TaxID=252190 RepID=A0AAN7BIA6_9PEZI|nr:NAD binding domain of 6-phosphogluconate dehydrogenase-domain-containing protein [Podospora fimiseda]